MSATISLADLIGLIRQHQGISRKTVITELSLLEKTLGITGDDGVELLDAIEQKFGISFAGSDGSFRSAFGVSDREYLFHSEGLSLFSAIAALLGQTPENVKEITVGDLYLAICGAKLKNSQF